MAYDARAVANEVIQIAEWNNLEITHLSLQKILYFAHAWYLTKFEKSLIGQRFEAWKYGPVLRVVYDQLKGSSKNINGKRLLSVDIDSAKMIPAIANFSDADQKFLEDIVRYYGKFHAGKLVDLTHEDGGPWDRIWKKAGDSVVLGMAISNSDIKQWFETERTTGGGLGELRSLN